MIAASSDLRATNRELLAADIAAGAVIPRGFPATLRVDTTTACRLQCLHCYKPMEEEGVVMPPDLYARLAREVFPHIDVVEFGADGEPLHDPHLIDRLRAIDPVDGPSVDFQTSGDGLLDIADQLAPRTRHLIVSVETLDPTLYPMVRKGSSLQGLLRGLEAFRAASNRGEGRVSSRIVARVTLFGGNHVTLPTLVEQLASAGVEEIWLQHGIALPGSHGDLGVADRAMDVGVALQRAVLQGNVSGVDVHYPSRRPRHPWSEGEVGKRTDGVLSVHAPWERASVSPGGTVSVCCGGARLHGAPSVHMGDGTFREAWASEPLQEARRKATRAPACGWCVHAEDPSDG